MSDVTTSIDRAVERRTSAPPHAAPTAEGIPGECLACGESSWQQVYPRHIPWLVRCLGCGMRFAAPQPTDEELAEIYNPAYYQTFGFYEDGQHSYRRMKQAWFDLHLARVETQFPRGRLLDVGSALGDMLVAAQQRGWQVQGVEPNQYAVELANELAPGATYCGGIEDFRPETDQFELITCSDVIEHLRRPDVFLEQTARLLSPGGGLVLTTIDVASHAARLLGRRWVHYHRDHLWYFDATSLARLAERAGLEVVWCEPARKVFNLNYICEIISRSRNSRLVSGSGRWAQRVLPRRLLDRLFTLREGLSLAARKPINSGASTTAAGPTNGQTTAHAPPRKPR